jgi:hypothetical protein
MPCLYIRREKRKKNVQPVIRIHIYLVVLQRKYLLIITPRIIKMAYKDILEEEVKNKIAQDYFGLFDCTKIIGKIDFCVTLKTTRQQVELHETESLLWAEAKKGKADIYKSIVQLILTIGKARTFDKQLPPAFLGAFDSESISFIAYNDIQNIFYQNDFNWNVTPSNHETKEFKQVLELVRTTIEAKSLSFAFGADDKELRQFITANFVAGKSETSKTRIDKNNFTVIYNKWLSAVKPTIAVDWELVKTGNIIDGDFYLADLLSHENKTLKDKLYVLLEGDQYKLDRKVNAYGLFNYSTIPFTDNQKAHQKFWNKYDRPPLEEYWDYIVERRDLLVPQDVRERKGSFFTPKIWVELSQKYLADVLGADWQDEYYIWDCAAGTGNLLTGLVNKYNIWASTLDKQDVDVMHDRIKNGTNLLESHVFQFDFLNDDFTKLPQGLQDIINDPEKRKKLVMYINPPYAEHTNKTNLTKTSFKDNLAQNNVQSKYGLQLGKAKMELFTLFFIRIHKEMRGSVLAEFSKLKILQAPNFKDFRKIFNAKLKEIFVVPADTFDNVKGQFPIGFMIWDTQTEEIFTRTSANIYDKNGNSIGTKTIYAYNDNLYINDWLKPLRVNQNTKIGILNYRGNDFQHQSMVFFESIGDTSMTQLNVNQDNLIQSCIYFAARHCITADWLNDRDQFLYPNDGWKGDKEFQNDCLAFALFDGQNQITSQGGVNHWIPFSEGEINARDKFASNFMSQYIAGKITTTSVGTNVDIFADKSAPAKKSPLVFSAEAKAVFDAGRELWRYYHEQPNCNVNASLYDIREHFQGRTAAGRMNSSSSDTQYTIYIKALREALKVLAKCIEEKVYLYGFLK